MIARLPLALACAIALFTAPAKAQTTYPEKTVRLVVPFPAGGATDIIARLIAERMSSDWHKPVVVENISGAAGATGTAQAAKSPPDGYTLLTGTGTTTTLLPNLRANLPYAPLRDLAAVAQICGFANLLVMRPDIPAKTVPELIDLLRANPGKYSYASTGFGTSTHLAAEWFKLLTKTDILHVPFTGSAPAQPALLGGHVDMMFDTLPSVWPLVQDGKLRALAVTTAQRVPFAPDIPTIAETLPDYEVNSWLGIMVPAGTPDDVKAKISASVIAFIQDPAAVQKLVTVGAVAAKPNTPQEFTARLQKEYEKYGEVIRATGIKLNN